MASKDEPGSIPLISKDALAQKRDIRGLNTRLEMLVRTYQENHRSNTSLKQSIAKQEVEYRNKMKQMELKYNDSIEKLRKENENLAFDNKRCHQELNNAMKLSTQSLLK